MFRLRIHLLCRLLACLVYAACGASAGEPFRYQAGSFEKASLSYINGLPVLCVEGTPQEIGRQSAALVGDGATTLLEFPQRLLAAVGREDRWPVLLELSQSLAGQCPADYRAELKAFAHQADIDPELLQAVNVMVDTYRGGFGCSSLIVDPPRSRTGGVVFGRNLDFFSQGVLQQYSLVVIYKGRGKHAFASVGFPGLLGCLSGMNDAGLALAVHEVFLSRDGGRIFNPKGIPYTLLFRRVLEECTTVQEAEELIRSAPRTTLLSLALCDRDGGAVLEITPKTVVLRRAENGLLACTNHFRTEPLRVFSFARRYRILMETDQIQRVAVDDVAKKLHQVNQGRLTLQTMIFQPDRLRLQLAIESCPSSALPLRRLELAPLFDVTDDDDP